MIYNQCELDKAKNFWPKLASGPGQYVPTVRNSLDTMSHWTWFKAWTYYFWTYQLSSLSKWRRGETTPSLSINCVMRLTFCNVKLATIINALEET